MKKDKMRYAVVGLGYISQVAVLPAFKNAKNSRLTALISGDPKKLKKLGRKYKVKSLYHYDQYDECLASGEIDAVYIALPNDLHREFSERAARAGIHVLCEKPMAVSSEDCKSMIRVAEESRVKLMIAYRLHFEEANLKAVELLKSGKIGEPRVYHSIFSIPIKEHGIRVTSRSQGGGPLYDIGIYCINAARYLFRSEPTEVVALSASKKKKPFDQVEESISVVMKFSNERLGSFICSFGCTEAGSFRVAGTKGDLFVENAFEFLGEKKHHLTVRGKTKVKKFKAKDQFGAEITYFSDCIIRNKKPEPSGEEGLIDVAIIEAIYRSLDSGQAEKVEVVKKEERPEIGQKMDQPEIEKPSLVHAEEPTGEEAA